MIKRLWILLIPLILTGCTQTDLQPCDEPEIVSEVIIPIPPEEQQEVAEKASAIEYLGEFIITHYCGCEHCSGKWGTMTATGVEAVEGITIAVDKNVIPYGTEVIIDGWRYIAQDCGGAIKGNRIDIYVEDHERAKKLGKYKTDVYIEED